MLRKDEAMYQAWLVINNLSDDDKKLIPESFISRLEDNMKYNENITIDVNKPLEKLRLDEKTWDILADMVKEIEKNGKKIRKDTLGNTKYDNNITEYAGDVVETNNNELEEYVKKCRNENETLNTKIDNIRLTKLIEILEKEKAKINEAKDLILDYRKVTKTKDEEIAKLILKIEKLKKNNEELYGMLNRIPAFLRKIFIKPDKI